MMGDTKKISNSLASFIAEDLLPLSLVENTGFRELMSKAQPLFQCLVEII